METTAGRHGYSVKVVATDGTTIDAVYCTGDREAHREGKALAQTYPAATIVICSGGHCQHIAGPKTSVRPIQE